MKLLKKYGIFIYWGLLFIDVFLINFTSYRMYRVYTKPLLMITLGVIFYINTQKSKHWRSKTLVYVGMFFSWLSDLVFLFNDINDTKPGSLNDDIYLFISLSLLLIAFVFYTFLFRKMSIFNIKDCQEGFLAFLAMVIVGSIFYNVISKEELTFFKPLIIIGLLISTLLIVFASNVHHNKIRRNTAVQFLIPGSITLIIAMGIIVAHRFLLKEASFLPAVIELTYGFGQMLIVRGFSKFLKA